nr:zonadhesin-like protein 1 [Pseudoips prasinana]
MWKPLLTLAIIACIFVTLCEAHHHKCPKNEIYEVCLSCPARNCGVNIAAVSCLPTPNPGDPDCTPGCRCRDFYLRDGTGKCIPEEQCPPVCGKHEVYSNCTNGGRGPYYCSDVGYSTDSVIDPRYCTEGCVCKNGYVRDDDNNCIPISNCPSCGGDPNAESGCGTYCGQLCTDYNIGAVACSDVCNENGCACRKGYVYDQIVGKCVLPDDCSSPQCKKQHQVYDPCLQSCPPRTCESIGKIYFCPRSRTGNECVGGCRCKNGYYTNSIGECISEKNCLKCNGPNEYYSCGGACDNVCETLSQQNQTHCPIVNVKCNPMCYCNKGYARNASNICIPINQCPKPQCGVNEIYEECPDALCTPQYCSELGFPQPCPDIPDRCPGPPGCVCANGYVRNKKGRCIPKANCPSCGGDPNAVSGCGVCQKRCSNYNKGPIPCPRICLINACNCRKGFVLDDNTGKCVRPEKCSPICGEDEVYSDCIQGGCEARNCSQLGRPIPCVKIDSKYCIKGCVCKEGTLRNDDGICVPEDQCNQCNGPHEYYDSCAPTCPPQTCESIGKVYHCPRAPQVCKGACRCEKGYFRNKIGDCISKANCLKCKGPHEYFSCGGACDNVCATLSEQNQSNCPIINIKCNPMCYCEEGYARDDSNTCIPIDQCPPPTCPVGERLEQCPTTLCAPQSCSQLGYPVPCDPIISVDSSCPGPPTCVCNNDFVRDDDGNCVSRQECPSCGGDPNAVSGCGVNCGRRCSNYNKKPGFCPLYCNLNGCDCKKGFVFDDNLKICVHPDDCTPTCSHNEVWDTCSNGGCNKRDCSEVDQPKICRDPITCIGGCVCQDGYLRADNGSCIPGDQCPESECPNQNEHYDPCPYECSPGTCDTIGKSYSCPAQIKCNPACVCDRDYYKNSIGECISEEDCLKCTGPNEYFSCGGACDNVCATLNEQNQTNCPIVNIVCNPMCYCIDGYARDDNNNCVPINECPPPTCSENERLEQCPAALCTPQSCSQLGFPVPCNPITSDNSSCPGPPACVCDNDLVRDDYGNCVPKQECPSCGGDPNAVSGCGVNCGRRCSNYNGDPGFCPLYCNPNGCDCKEDFVFDDNLKICVLPDDCTPTCSYEEVWDTCSNGGCDKRDCSQLDQPKICRAPITCIGACVCKEGYLRADNGSCIPGDQCPESVCSNQNEHYDPCPYECSPGTCDTIGKSYSCPAHIKCNPSCVCDKDYYKNSIGQCISAEDCLKCGPDEYFTCGGACDNVCSTLATRNQTHCPIRHKRCHYKCYCNEGYARDDNDVCIPIEQCGVTCAGDPNAVPGCGINCGRHCSDPSSGPVFCPDICLVGGCDCKENYVFDDNLYKCVLPGDCSPVCGDNEVYNKCINGGCNRKNCADLSLPSVCKHPRTCKEGCLCADGYLRDGNGTCVPEDQCPSSCNGDINARPGCGVNCGRHCSNYNRDVACIDICYENACDCKDDYVYDDNTGMCVLPCDCTPICGANEVYDQCSNGGCVRRYCSELSEPIICKDVIECIGDCVCADGFLRNDDGVCVAENECRPMCSGV